MEKDSVPGPVVPEPGPGYTFEASDCDPDVPWEQVEVRVALGCGLHTDGCVECWGTWAELTPTECFSQISMGCGVTVDGETACWAPADVPAIAQAPTSG